MAASTLALRLRAHASLGPALGHAPVPLRTIALSALVHVVFVGALIATGLLWGADDAKMPEIVIVPSTAMLGKPEGRPAPTPHTQSTATSTPAPTKPPELPPAAPALPASRDLPPARPLDVPRLPTREPAPARATLPRPGEKELPTAPPPPPAPPAGSTMIAKRSDALTPPPPAPQGQATGTTDGTAAVTVSGNVTVSSLYLSRIFQKVNAAWRPPPVAVPHPPIIAFELDPDGHPGRPRIERTSGNPAYDQAALRAIVEASPFPPFPEDLKEPLLRLHLRFNLVTDRG
jgi:TonB family protein